jgi:hypothetical protein
MKTIEINLYQFDELNDKAKEQARDWYRSASAADDISEHVIEDAVEIAKRLGITFRQRDKQPCVLWSGFSSQGDGASFEGSYCAPEGSASASDLVKAYAPQDETLHAIAASLDRLQHKHGNTLDADIVHRGRYYHALTMHLESVTARDADSELIDVDADDEQELLETLRGFANWIYSQLETEHDYRNSNAYVDETIRANEYDFHADGTRARI